MFCSKFIAFISLIPTVLIADASYEALFSDVEPQQPNTANILQENAARAPSQSVSDEDPVDPILADTPSPMMSEQTTPITSDQTNSNSSASTPNVTDTSGATTSVVITPVANSTVYKSEPSWYYVGGLKNRQGGGVGYRQGYTTLQGLFGRKINDSQALFVDARAHLFNSARFASNLGVGYRFKPWEQSTTFGFNLYYDFRGAHQLYSNQLSAGFEILSNKADFRMNGYVPLGSVKGKIDLTFDRFIGYNAQLQQKRQSALNGIDAEIGRRLFCKKNISLYGAIGSYYFARDNMNTRWGTKARLKAEVLRILSFEASISHDHLFKTRVQGEVALNFPIGKDYKDKASKCLSTPDLLDAPYRQEIIVMKHLKKSVLARDANGNALRFVHVDNSRTNGNGTSESPLNSLSGLGNIAQSQDVIYLHSGSGTTYDGNISMYGNQNLLGSGINQTVNSQFGSFVIPAQSTAYPTITNSNAALNGGDAVTVLDGAGDIVIRGVNINSAAGRAVYIHSPSNSFTMQYGTVTVSPTGTGVYAKSNNNTIQFLTVTATGENTLGSLVNLFGNSVVTNNTLSYNHYASALSLLTSETNNINTLTAVVRNNSFSSVGTGGTAPNEAILLFGDGSASTPQLYQNVSIVHNTFAGQHQAGIVNISNDNYTSYNGLHVDSNTFESSATGAPDLIYWNDSGTGTIQNSTVRWNTYPSGQSLTNLNSTLGTTVTGNVAE